MLHRGMSAGASRREAIRLLDRVGIPDAARRVDAYPHQFSGGQRQRVTIAIALACGPDLLIADEPTTALDVTIQRQILDLIAGLVEEDKMALILISHDLGVIAENVERTLVMYGGALVEEGPTEEVFARPSHPYTQGLFGARPRLGAGRGAKLATIKGTVPELADMPPGCPFAGRCPLTIAACDAALPAPVELSPAHAARCIRLDVALGALMSAPLLELDKLVKLYALPRESLWAAPRQVTALAGVSLSVSCGTKPRAGRRIGLRQVHLGAHRDRARSAELRRRAFRGAGRRLSFGRRREGGLRRDVQMVFQDPYGSLDPRRTVGWIVAEPLWTQSLGRARRAGGRRRGSRLRSGFARPMRAKYPHEFSGGQRQRIAIARALITKPRLIIADEPVSALDVSVQAQVLNLLEDLQRDFGVTFLLISHDLAVVDHVCDRVAVMYRGRIVEEGSPRALFQAPAHPYTRALIAAMPKPIPGRRREPVKGSTATAPTSESA